MAGKGGTSGFKYSFLTDKVYLLKLVRRGIVSKGWTCIPLGCQVAGPGLGRGEKEEDKGEEEEEGGRRKQREEARR